MFMLLLPWRHAPLLSVTQYYFKIHLSEDERHKREKKKFSEDKNVHLEANHDCLDAAAAESMRTYFR